MRTKIFALALSVLLTLAILLLPISLGSSNRQTDTADENVIKFNLTKYSVIQDNNSKPKNLAKTKSKSADKSLPKEEHSKSALSKDMSFASAESRTQHSENKPAKDMSFEKADLSENPENEPSDMSFEKTNRTEHSTQESQTAKQIVYKPDFKIDKRPIYPAAARRMGQQGRVGLTVFVDKSGKVINVIATPSSGFSLLDNAAISAVKQWNFSSLNLQNQMNVIKTEVIFELN